MSPAMVEIVTPAKEAAAEAASRNPSDKGQIFAPLFDQSSNFINRQGENPNPVKSMDQSNSFVFPPVSSSGKPSLSKPRLVKVRRNAAAYRKKTAALQEPDPNSSFNPFWSEKNGEKISTWNPFVPESGDRVSESQGANGSAFSFGGANSNAGAFVFGSGGPNWSRDSSSRSMGSFESIKSEGVQFVSDLKSVDIGSGFVFGSGVKKSNDLSRDSSFGSDEGLVFSNLPDEMRKLDLRNPGNGDGFERENQAEKPFVFGGGIVNKLPEYAESVSSAGMGNDNSDAGGFVFRRGVKKSVDLRPNLSFSSDEGSLSKLPDEMSKLNLKNSSNVDDYGKEQAEHAFIFGGGINVAASSNGSAEFVSSTISGPQLINVGSDNPTSFSFSSGSERGGNSDAAVCTLGSETKKSVDMNPNLSLGSEKGPFSKLPDEMMKLNLKNTGNMDDFEKKLQAGNVFVSGSSNAGSRLSSGSAKFTSEKIAAIVLGSEPINTGLEKPTVGSVNSGSKGSGNPVAGAFVFSGGVKKSVDSSQNFSLGSDDGLFSMLPGEISKMNLGSGDGFQKTKKADGVFVLGGNKDVPGSFGSGIANKVHEETGKLNVVRETKTQSMKNESAGSAAGIFVFGSSTGQSSISSFDNGTAFNLDKNFSTQDLDKGKETGCKEKGDGNASGTSKNASASFVNMVHDDMAKLKIGSNTENLAGRVPFEDSFQAGKDQSSNMGCIPSSPAPGFESLGSMFSFAGKPVGLETLHMEFKTPKQDAAQLTRETLFSETHQNIAFSAKKGDTKSTKMKKKRGKSRQSVPVYQSFPMQFVSEESGPQVNPEVDLTDDCSPMDYSPYNEDVVTAQYPRQPSVASEDSTRFVPCGPSTDGQRSVAGDEREEVLVSEAQRPNISEGNICQRVGNDGSKDNVKRSSNAESLGAENFWNSSDVSKHENVDLENDLRTSPMESETGFFSPNFERPASEVRTGFTFSSSLENPVESKFAFTASPFVQGPLSAVKNNHRRKNRLKSAKKPSVSTPNTRAPLASSLPDLIPCINTNGPDSVEGQQSPSSVPQSEDQMKTGKSKEAKAREESTSSAAASVAAQEACEKWRLRGNQAYASGHLTKAEDYYTCGVNSVSLKEIPSICIRPLTLCYSNRAATRMSLGRMREALRDCMKAVSIDPNFLKAQLRGANCLLALGEIREALKYFKKCLQSEKDSCSDQKYLIEASNGLKRAQQVADLTGQSAEMLLSRKSIDASKALNMISEALSISPHSESLLEMKAEALLMMRNYEEVIKLCEQTLDLAEQNSTVRDADSQSMNFSSSEYMKSSPPRLWRWRLIAKSYFYLGKLEEALELLQKHENLTPAPDRSSGSSASLAVTIQELLRLKSAGNEAFQAARHSEAVEYYSSALTCNAESRPFTAVCFCNRAAAYQALGQITDAIADCSLAIALDPNYPKAISRRATLHEMIRDYGQAANDLNRLISLLQKQMEKKDNQSRGVGRSTANGTDLKRAQARLATVEEEARKGISLSMYIILGIESSSSAADIKKAYRKAALRHHPDKAGQFLVRNDNFDEGLWREVAAEVHADADRLFKMIGEAYTILSDPTKRLQYDDEEEMRACPVKGYNVSTPKTSSDYYGNHYERSYRRQWRAHGTSYQRW